MFLYQSSFFQEIKVFKCCLLISVTGSPACTWYYGSHSWSGNGAYLLCRKFLIKIRISLPLPSVLSNGRPFSFKFKENTFERANPWFFLLTYARQHSKPKRWSQAHNAAEGENLIFTCCCVCNSKSALESNVALHVLHYALVNSNRTLIIYIGNLAKYFFWW